MHKLCIVRIVCNYKAISKIQESQIWIKLSLVEQNASKPKRLNNDIFIEEAHHSNDWGWMKGCIIHKNEEILTMRTTDYESIFIGKEVIISNKELQMRE